MATGRARTVGVASKHELLREGLRSVLARRGGFEFVGSCGCVRDVEWLVVHRQPNLLLIGAELLLYGPQELARFIQRRPTMKVVLLTQKVELDEQLAALRAGAAGLLPSNASSDSVVKCLRTVSNGGYWVDQPSVADVAKALPSVTKNPSATHATQLTARQAQVVDTLLDGASNKEIAKSLGISEQTVKNHLREIYSTLCVGSRVELAQLMRRSQAAAPRSIYPDAGGDAAIA